MGNIIGRSNVMSGPSGLKMESQRIVDFGVKVKTADTIRARLESYKMGNGTTSSQGVYLGQSRIVNVSAWHNRS
eukprot:15281952-Ditylum_brightwellii.AAC.1